MDRDVAAEFAEFVKKSGMNESEFRAAWAEAMRALDHGGFLDQMSAGARRIHEKVLSLSTKQSGFGADARPGVAPSSLEEFARLWTDASGDANATEQWVSGTVAAPGDNS